MKTFHSMRQFIFEIQNTYQVISPVMNYFRDGIKSSVKFAPTNKRHMSKKAPFMELHHNQQHSSRRSCKIAMFLFEEINYANVCAYVKYSFMRTLALDGGGECRGTNETKSRLKVSSSRFEMGTNF